jgi:lipid II isoglutaminyl synthase (glutamine-hydrolysing)
MNTILILLGKLVILISRILNLGNGSTWPGHIALSVNKNFIKGLMVKNPNLKIILIAGTNGKTTTGKLIQSILEKDNKKVFQNAAGANLLNGIASSLILNSDLNGSINNDFAVFEIDENTLPVVLKEIPNPSYVLLLNLFRDQLDRYGEVNTIVGKWKDTIRHLSSATKLVLNADDPQVAYLGLHLEGVKVNYFGIDSKNSTNKIQHASDSTYCPKCNEQLIYSSVYFSHLGNWKCPKCNCNHPQNAFLKSPYYPLSGIYNEYNINAAVLICKMIGVGDKVIISGLKDFAPAFGRQEELKFNGKSIQIFLSKNPTSLNVSLATISEMKAKNLLLVLNDRIPDGRDVSWIWDVDFEDFITQFKNIVVTGDRTYDIGLRLKYAGFKIFTVEDNLENAINIAIDKTPNDETLYVLATYSAMLEVRKILTGKKIL